MAIVSGPKDQAKGGGGINHLKKKKKKGEVRKSSDWKNNIRKVKRQCSYKFEYIWIHF